jgi:uncharacterized protein (DUF2236 family)
MRVFVPAHRLATVALLPPRLRAEYGMPWSRRRAVALAVAARSVSVTATPVLRAASRFTSAKLILAEA